MKQITFKKTVKTLQAMIDGKSNAIIQVEYEVPWGDDTKHTLTARYERVNGEVIYGFPGREIENVTPAVCREIKWFKIDYGAKVKDKRYATRFYLVD